MSLAEYQAIPGFSKPPETFFTQFVAHAEKRRTRQALQPSSFPDLARAAREQLFYSVKEDLIASLHRLSPVKSDDAAMANLRACWDPLIERSAPWTVPSLQVLANIDAAATFHRRNIVQNDMYDFLHAAEAIPYCDAFFCDKPLANLLRSKPLELHVAYSTVVHGSPEDILAYLD